MGHQNFQVNKIFGSKKFWLKKIFVSKKIRVKKFLDQTFLGGPKNLESKKFLGHKFFDQKDLSEFFLFNRTKVELTQGRGYMTMTSLPPRIQ